jgi:hypothetical protein
MTNEPTDPIEEYIEFEASKGYYPLGHNLFYECQKCHKRISMTKESVCCDCYNICIDVDAGRFSMKEPSMVKLVRRWL